MASTELNCLFCNESFEDREQLQIHFRKHGDPKFNQNVKSNKSVSENDSNINNEVSNDAADTVSCDVCEDVFPSISKAITHKHKMHPDHDAKYFCPWCGKLFTMKHLYNKHIEKNHTSKESTGSGFHCDHCDVDFFAAAAMIYHNKFFHRQDTELASIGYSKKMKHFDQEVLPIYYCPFCGEEYINKVNLHKHMGDDHMDENQSPDDVLRCPLCEAIFYHLDAYELHLTFHSDTDIYIEQNDIVKSITEFSLEAVPPLMEKVENEVQEDAEADMGSIGIENFLQQAMNESNDNSNSDIPHKKKKHKKHKKSKKATITLDEFLSMNTDVFGEGIDLQVQGIEEVPSQVVAKQLRKPMNVKKRPTAMQSKEIEKLRKQGIVIKKNTGNFNKPNALTMKANSFSTVKQKLPSMPQSKTTLRSTDDVINKLMSQGNSQIKIVKKPSQNSNSESDTGSGPPNIFDTKNDTNKTTETEDHETTETEDHELQGNQEITEIRLDKDHTSPIQEEDMEIGEVDLSKPIPLKWKVDPPFGNGTINNQGKGSKSTTDVLKSIGQHITIKQMTKSGTPDIKNIIAKESGSEAKISEDEHKISHETKNNQNLHALKRLGLTVKSLNQAQNQSVAFPLKSDFPGDNPTVFDSTTVKRKLNDSPKDRKDGQCSESPNMIALRNISKHITVKSPTAKLSAIVQSDMADGENKEVPVDSDGNDTNNKHTKIMQKHPNLKEKPEINSDVLENINKHITARAHDIGIDHAEINSEDETMHNLEEDENTLTKSPNVVKDQSQSKSLDALKNLSKYITVKPPNKSLIVTDGRSEDGNVVKIKDHENNTVISTELLQSSINDVQSKCPKVISSQPQTKSLNALKHLSKHITIKSPNKTIINTRQDESIDNDEFKAEGNESDDDEILRNDEGPSLSSKDIQSPNNSNKSLDVLKNLSKNITIKAPYQSISKNDTGSDHEDQDDTNTFNKNIATKKNEKLQELSRTNATSQKFSQSLDVLKNLSKNITIKSPSNKTDNYEEESDISVCKNPMKGQNLKSPDKSPTPVHRFKSPEIRKVSLNPQMPNKSLQTTYLDKTTNSQIVRKQMAAELDKMENPQIAKNQSLDIMKKFPNITAKSLSATNIKECVKQQVSSSQSMNIVQGRTFQKCVETEQTSEEIETYNIDDSEDEETHTPKSEEHFETSTENHNLVKKSADAVDAIMKLNSDITIKPNKNIPETNSPRLEEKLYDDDENGNHSDDPDSSSNLAQHENANKAKLQETLKNLGKNICIKPTGSPRTIPKSTILNPHVTKLNPKSKSNSQPSILKRNIQSTLKNISKHVSVKSSMTSNKTETNEMKNYSDEDDNDLDQYTNVKITEMGDCSSDDETIRNRLENTDSNVIVQTPSDNEDVGNIEDEIQPSIINKKQFTECSAVSENQLVKHFNQNPRLKSMQDFNFDDDDEHDAEDENPDCDQKVSKTLFNRQTNQSKTNSSQIVNKEVRTVQTFQSETVIEEITTTVTKTIRTVNQAVKQESRGLNPGLPQMRQKFQGTANLPHSGNFRGIQVRQSRPTMGSQVRHFGPRTRPGMIRPNAPLRPNDSRASVTRMPVFRQNLRAPNAQKVETRPMKIASNAIVASAKRPSQEPPGHFSCFKKPKESLIPVLDVPQISMTMNKTNNSAQQVKTSAQMTKSNYSTTTNVIKGNSVMTSTQNKSEMRCSTEQKLNNMSGLKIVKTSTQQALQVEERNEVSVPKRSNAMEAIERLQSMGLLVKKPKVDDSAQDDDGYNVPSEDDCLDDDEQ